MYMPLNQIYNCLYEIVNIVHCKFGTSLFPTFVAKSASALCTHLDCWGGEGGPRKFPVTECCLEPVTSSLGRMLIAQFLVCPAPEALPLAKVTRLRNCHLMNQGFHKFWYPISHPAYSKTKKPLFFYANLETGKRAWCIDFWHRGLPRIPRNSPSLAPGRKHYLMSCSGATPRLLTFVGDLLLKRPSPHLIWHRRDFIST